MPVQRKCGWTTVWRVHGKYLETCKLSLQLFPLFLYLISVLSTVYCTVYTVIQSVGHICLTVSTLIGPSHTSLLAPTLWLIQPNCWWDAERQECMPCRCSRHGSISQRCDVEGRCICRPGYVGRRCDLRRQSYERRETRRPVERVPLEAAHARLGGLTRSGGCPRGAYRPRTGVTHTACGALCVWPSMAELLCYSSVWRCAPVKQGLNRVVCAVCDV